MTDFEKDFSADDPQPAGELVRQQSWPAEGPAELELSVDVGRITVHLDEQEVSEVRVEVRHDPSAGNSWTQGLTGILSWLGNQAGGGENTADLAVEAVRATQITWSETGRRLVVKSPSDLPLRVVPLAVTVVAPPLSRLTARTGAGDVRVGGVAGWAAVRTGGGAATVAAVAGDADVVTGSGDIDLGPVTGRSRVRSGSGNVRLASIGGNTEVKAGSGDVTVDDVDADLTVRTGSGEITLNDARSGRVQLNTGSGALRVALHPGVAAELDLSTGSGRTRSDLEVGHQPPAGPTVLRVNGRTGSGNVLVTRAAVAV